MDHDRIHARKPTHDIDRWSVGTIEAIDQRDGHCIVTVATDDETMSGDVLEREDLEVYIGGELVYNETANSESNVGSGSGVPGLILEVDDDDFNDLNKPCRFKPVDCTPSDPPGDGDGADPGVVFEWEENVSAGQRLTIQERNDSQSYDVIEPGDSIKVVYRRDGFTSVIAEETIEPAETP